MADPSPPGPPAALAPASSGRGPGSATRGRVVDLLPLGLVRIEALYEIALVGGAGITWRTRGRTVSLERFAAFLWEAGDCAFGVVERPSGRLVGFVGLYGTDTVSGVASLSAFFDPRQARAVLLAGDALETFCRYAFEVIGLRKLTLEIPASLATGLLGACGRLPFLTLEGTLRAHARMGRTVHDLEVYAVWADAFQTWLHDDAPEVPDPPERPDAVVRVRRVLTRLCPRDVPHELSGGHRLVEDLGLDSLAVIELVVALEAELGRPLPADAIGDHMTVQDVVTLIEHTGAAALGLGSGVGPTPPVGLR